MQKNNNRSTFYSKQQEKMIQHLDKVHKEIECLFHNLKEIK